MNLSKHQESSSQETTTANKPKWLRRNFLPFTMLIVVVIISALVVQHFKKPGQMSVIESQAMDMSTMQPPPGAVPVAIAIVKPQQIEGSVTYTGTVQAYEDEDIYPRIAGRIVSMPVYPGDRVTKGQLLVQLDPPNHSEYAAKLAESSYAADAAMHNSSIAREELTQKSYDLEAAKAAESAAGDELQQAKSDLDYWIPEIKREENLLKAQVISQQEYDDESNKYKQALSKVRQLEAKLRQASNARLSANAAYEAAGHHVGHIAFAARGAEALKQSADIIDSYTRIRSQADGIVVKRLVSPGVVVEPGTLILKISHLSQVRIQAEVASEDAEKIAVGNTVYIKNSEMADKQMVAKVTSIFPAADAVTRTVIVEALVDNVISGASRNTSGSGALTNLTSFRMLPGEYVVIEISIGRKEALAIPSSAVIWREGKAHVWKATGGVSKTGNIYTCIMHPEIKEDKPGKCPKCGMDLVSAAASGTLIAQRIPVMTGLSNEHYTEITSGLSEGDQVIYQGYSSLRNGLPVIATEWGEKGPIKLPEASSVQGNRLDSSNHWTNDIKLENLNLHLTTLPNPPKGGNNTIVCTLTDAQASVVKHAFISAKTSMPTMSMAGPDLSGTEQGQGNYQLASNFMSGLWEVRIRVNNQEATFDIEVP